MPKSKNEYVHGYSEREKLRLKDQANTLSNLLHCDSLFPEGSRILEAGCAVGATTAIVAQKNPNSFFTSVDISEESISKARQLMNDNNIKNVEFMKADIFNLPFDYGSFDHIFACFVLEHLDKPREALKNLKKYLKPGGSIMVIEGDHGSAYFYPESREAHLAIQCQVDLQARYGGNSLIGRELFPLLKKTGYDNVYVSPRMVYVDSSRPKLVEGFTKNTFTAMVEGVKYQAIQSGLIDEKHGKRELPIYIERQRKMEHSAIHSLRAPV